MSIDELKERWNKGLERVKKAEKLAAEDPERFEKFINNFNELTKEMSSLMRLYKKLTGEEMSQDNFQNGF